MTSTAMTPIDLVGAAQWRRAVFTTYALSLSFFEAVVLDALVRGRSREASIYADALGVKAALSEQGAQRVGRDYDVEPIAVSNGYVFHPKITALLSDDDCHILVGSGNLTFNGWGGNLEMVEHLHPSFAADAVVDIAGFFDDLGASTRLRHGIALDCSQLANELRGVVRGRPLTGDVRVFHSLSTGISQQIVEAAVELGGATRLVAAAPFWDKGQAIDTLCNSLGLAEVFVHSHSAGTVRGDAGANWPVRPAVKIHPVEAGPFSADKGRLLHAKAFEVLCKRGRLVVSGSANASTAALGQNRNVEACVVRLQRNVMTGWTYTASVAPELVVGPEAAEDEASESNGVLRAAIAGDKVEGQVLSPRMVGPAMVFQLTGEGPKPLGPIELDDNGAFQLNAPSIELEVWRGGRLVIRVESQGGARAEGFVSVAAFTEIKRRAGLLAPRFLALLAGTEVPADVSAIMAFFNENPKHLEGLGTRRQISGAKDDAADEGKPRLIPVDELSPEFTKEHAASIRHASAENSWRRFMEIVHSAFRERRGPFPGIGDRKEDDENDEDNDSPQDASPDPAIPRLLENFARLFDQLTSVDNAPRFALLAYDLSLYVCERTPPDRETARSWVSRLASVLSRSSYPADRSQDIAAFYLYWLALGGEPDNVRSARSHVLRSGFSVDGKAPSSDAIATLRAVLPSAGNEAELWGRIQTTRTNQERMRAYVKAYVGEGVLSSEDRDGLKRALPQEWATLEAALTTLAKRTRIRLVSGAIDACPKHGYNLPRAERSKLQNFGVATTINCCGQLLINQEV